MPILKRVSGTNLMTLSAMASQLQTAMFKTSVEDALPVSFIEDCEKPLPVFGDLLSNDALKNDFTSIIKREGSGSAITFWLLDEYCNELAELNDDTYGEYFAKGFVNAPLPFPGFPPQFVFQNQYKGYKVDWKKVLQVLGHGYYKIKIKEVGPKGTIEECSCLFELCQFTEERADETIRFEVTQNGKTLNEDLDYRYFNWKQQYRIYGFFGHTQRRLEQDNYLDKNRITTQIQDQIIHEYSCESYFFPSCLRPVLDSILLANEILISDYNILNTDDLKNISVIPTSIDSEYFGKSTKVADEIKFEERRKDRIKRNVK